MAKKVFNMQGGNHSAAALSAFFNAALYGDVASGLKVVPTGTTGASVRVEVGTGQIDTGQGFSRIIQIDTAETVPLTAASPANLRRDLIVAYIDNTVTPTLSVVDNINGVLKFIAVSGNPSATPADPSASTIQAAVGPGNPYITLGRVRVAPSATSFAVGDIDDLRKLVTLLPGRINSSDMINDGIIVSSKINYSTFPMFAARASATQTNVSGQTLQFGYEYYDVGGVFNAATGIFTAPVDGIYKFSSDFTLNGTDAGQELWGSFTMTGQPAGQTDRRFGRRVGQGSPNIAGTLERNLKAGDTVRIVATTTGANRSLESTFAYFSGELIARASS